MPSAAPCRRPVRRFSGPRAQSCCRTSARLRCTRPSKFAGRAIPTAPVRNHYHEFLDAVLAGPGTVCSAGFDYASLVTEAVLLGSVAEHYPNETLTYDPAAMRVTNRKEPNGHLARKFRKKYLLTRL